jgi:RNA polymerase sigma-70 factor (ECF subfamily)
MTDPSDVELVQRLGSADPREREAAFAVLFDRHRQKAFDLAWRVLGDAALAADAVQEAFLTVYRKGPRFEARAQFTSWLYRVVMNQSIDLRRRERRHRMASLGSSAPGQQAAETSSRKPPATEHAADPASPHPGPEQTALDAETASRVRAAIERLSPKLAAVVVLRYPKGLSYEEIGEILDLPPGTVRSRLNRAHAALREILGSSLDLP